MEKSQIYIAVIIIVLVIIAIQIFLLRGNKRTKKLSPIAGLAFGFMLIGLYFGEDQLIGYSMMGFGLVLAIIDIFMKYRENKFNAG